VLAEVTDPLTHLARQGAAGKGARRRQQVTAYMPGRVVSVLVAAGDSVQPGQGVLVLEAMKMENEIQAEHDGVIQRVCVAPGQAVEGGDVLFELE
jgi:biotin carboxyl carrier protein